MYSLAYGMMVQVLRQLKYSGEFEANVAHHAALKGGGRVVLVVQNGNIISCFIFDKYGQKLYYDAEAHRLLPSLGVLDWKRVATNSGNAIHSDSSGNIMTPPPIPGINRTANPITPPMMPNREPVGKGRHSIPRRFQVSETQVRTWSALERSVYFLTDGVRNTEQIAMILSRPPAEIEQIIGNLEAAGAITRS